MKLERGEFELFPVETTKLGKIFLTSTKESRRRRKNPFLIDLLQWLPTSWRIFCPLYVTWLPNLLTWLQNMLPNLLIWLPNLPTWLPNLATCLPYLPSWLPNLPTWLPNLPTWLPNLPTGLPYLPTWLPNLPIWLCTNCETIISRFVHSENLLNSLWTC